MSNPARRLLVNDRISALFGKYEAEGAEAMLISALPNIRYLSGFTGSNGLLVVSRKNVTLLTDPRYALQAAQQVSFTTHVTKGALIKSVGAWISRHKTKRLAVERNRIGWETVELLREISPHCTLVGMNGAVEELRMCKSPGEMNWIRESVETNSRAFEAALKNLRVGMTEAELAGEIEYQQRLAGAESPAFDTIVAGGPRSALPHARPTAAPIPTRGALLIDMGCFQSGYASDMTRTLYIGKAPRRFKAMYGAVLEAQMAAIDAARPGVKAAHVDRAARRILQQHGLGKNFVHSTGHGLGLEIHEPPRIGNKADTVLQAGFAITVEPGVYVDGYGGIRIEDTVHVTDAGPAVLTAVSKHLVEW